ncbi:hypothetical protein [Aliiglaciecola sp. LCG003]|uniref:hypothetical protein n=1 Tax=Aliiglaciecola sp. LCG003 TaxID=3053655 RepID=UPI0025730E7C|nr:hypothetical protein [Aliiglaciecola sp. LCG003]WJG09622.1 hypothetical protein QR722_00875 [Aliiglaciecola sp. LCG003]
MSDFISKHKWQIQAILTALFFLFLNLILGVIVVPHSHLHEIQYRDIGAALALPTIGAFCFVVLPLVVDKARLAFLQTALETRSCQDIAIQYSREAAALPKKYLLVSFGLASMMMFCYFYTEGLFYVDELGFELNVIRFPLVVQALFMWTSIILSLICIYKITRLIDSFVEHHLKVELFRADELFPIANTVFWNALFFSFAVALAPLFWLGGTPGFKDFIIAMTLLFLMINLIFYPLLRVRHIIKKKKMEVVRDYRHSGSSYSQQWLDSSSFMANFTAPSPNRIKLSALGGEIVKADQWSENLHLTIRFCFLLLIPTLSWVGSSILSAIIEILQGS